MQTFSSWGGWKMKKNVQCLLCVLLDVAVIRLDAQEGVLF